MDKSNLFFSFAKTAAFLGLLVLVGLESVILLSRKSGVLGLTDGQINQAVYFGLTAFMLMGIMLVLGIIGAITHIGYIKINFFIHLIFIIAISLISYFNPLKSNTVQKYAAVVLDIVIPPTPSPFIFPTPTPEPEIIYPTPTPKTYNPYFTDSDPWGKAKQISEHGWSMKIENDPVMATPREIYDAINAYRITKGSTHLSWDDRLAKYAQSRSDYFWKIGKVDEHEGFINFVKDPDYVNILGFATVSENASYGFKMTGTHLVEYVYAGDDPHNDNQLNKDWLYVGIGVAGTATDLIFGK